MGISTVDSYGGAAIWDVSGKMLRTEETVAELRADLATASQMYPGADYKTVLGWVHESFLPETYLEIGVSGGGSFAKARPDTLRVGVDPADGIAPLSWPNVSIETMTSNAFFDSGCVDKYFRNRKIDFCFIDGSHLMEQVVEDFANVMRHIEVGGIVALHDVLPIRPEVAAREKHTLMWTGDVWKAALAIHEIWPQPSKHIVRCIPSGLMLVRVDEPVARADRSRIDAGIGRHISRNFDVRAKADIGQFPVLGNTRASVTSFGTDALKARRDHTSPTKNMSE